MKECRLSETHTWMFWLRYWCHGSESVSLFLWQHETGQITGQEDEKHTKYLSVTYTALFLTKRNNWHSKLLLSWSHKMTVKLISWLNKYQPRNCSGKIINHVSFQMYKTFFCGAQKEDFEELHVSNEHNTTFCADNLCP